MPSVIEKIPQQLTDATHRVQDRLVITFPSMRLAFPETRARLMSGESTKYPKNSKQLKDWKDSQNLYNKRFDGITYYDKMPNAPQNQTSQTVEILDDQVKLQAAFEKYKQQQIENNKKLIGESKKPETIKEPSVTLDSEKNRFYGPNVGIVQYAMVKNRENGEIKYFFPLWSDGAIDKNTGIPTPGSVVAPIHIARDYSGKLRHYVIGKFQERPVLFNGEIPNDILSKPKEEIEKYIEEERGRLVFTTTGGFAVKGENPEETATRQAKEHGLELLQFSFKKAYFNRGSVQNPINIGFAFLQGIQDPESVKNAKKYLGDNIAVPLEDASSEDAMVQSALEYAREHLGYIKAPKLSKSAAIFSKKA